ncbi:transmembrane protease serine 9 isoform X1 [Amphiprion ocellaris]|uniref:transmembrane protease serine 9 isoform X1 n=1 Tax=Amphiprion ocellaris TaxID=80972 RepID=UPI002410E1E1|nr:transmembrane protease serine 9 isoform X1 [Amphiprion ocellaris]
MQEQMCCDGFTTMAFYKVICATTVLLILLLPESESQLDVCGLASLNTRIVGGQDAPPGFWPWQVSVNSVGGFQFCGGSLMNNQWVLSAAHCFSRVRSAIVYVGRQSQQGSNPNEVSRTVSQIIIHPNYDSSTLNNDIALLRLSSSVTFSTYIAPVCLAASDSTFHAGVNTWVTGWGTIASGVSNPFPQNLMEVQVPIVGGRQCNCSYGVGQITDNMLCAGLPEGGRDSCQGDSGGPLVIKQGNRWILSGVVSFGNGCALARFPGVYTKVSRYQTWINEQIISNQPGFITFRSTGTDSDLSVTCPGLPPVTTTLPPTTTPKPVVCGQAPRNSRILGGSSVATEGVWPWMASLQKNGSHVCGGTLVAVDSVLSDAKCFSSLPVASDWTVVLGRLRQNGSNPFEVTMNVTNITLSSLNGSNVAVLTLSGQPTLSDYIQPICLDSGRTFAVGTVCWAAGWSSGRGGEEQILQELQTSIVDCGNASSSDNICTGNFTLEQGYSGSPLMCKEEGTWFQVAVLSVENNSIEDNSTEISLTPDNSTKIILTEDNSTRVRLTREFRANNLQVFTRVSHFQNFLTQTLGTLLSPASTNNTINITMTSNTTATTNTLATTDSTNTTNSTNSTYTSAAATISVTTGGAPVHSSSVFFFFHHFLLLALGLQLFS